MDEREKGSQIAWHRIFLSEKSTFERRHTDGRCQRTSSNVIMSIPILSSDSGPTDAGGRRTKSLVNLLRVCFCHCFDSAEYQFDYMCLGLVMPERYLLSNLLSLPLVLDPAFYARHANSNGVRTRSL